MTYQFKPGMYKTRDGRDARVLCDDAPGDFALIGYITLQGGYFCCSWTHSGDSTSDKTKHPYDLMPPRMVAWQRIAGRNGTYGDDPDPPSWVTHRITYYTDGECVVEKL